VPGRPPTVLSNAVFTYNFPDKYLGGVTYGGYSDSVVVDERYVLHVPANLDLAGTAPLLCAGITTYSPMRHWGVTQGKKVGVVGLGGLGHMAVKFAHALGAHVVVFTTSPNKKDDALRLGAHEVVVSGNANEMQSRPAASTSSWTQSPPITTSTPISTCWAVMATSPWWAHPRSPSKWPASVFCLDGAAFPARSSAEFRRRRRCSIFCGARNITSDVEVIPMQKVNEAYERLLKGT